MLNNLQGDYLDNVSNELGSHDIFLLNITRKTIESLDFEFVEKTIEHLQTKGATSFQSVIIMFDGYNDTQTEVYEIQEIRKWVGELFALYPHFLYFINYSVDSHITLLSCIGDIQISYRGSQNLSPNEYHEKGINPLTDVEQKQWIIRLQDSIYNMLAAGLINYSIEMKLPYEQIGTTIKMINTIANRK